MSTLLATADRPRAIAPTRATPTHDRLGTTVRLLAGVAIVSAAAGSLLTVAVWAWLHADAGPLPQAPAAAAAAADAAAPKPAPASPLGGPAVNDVLIDRAEPPLEPPPAS